MAITPFKVIQGHSFWYQSKAHNDFLLVINTNLAILHRWPIIRQIFAIDMGVPHFNALTGADPLRISG